jgi:hypothetical protein
LDSTNAVTHVIIDFFDPVIGENFRQKHKNVLRPGMSKYVPIPRISTTYTLGNAKKNHICSVKLLQFPLRLAYAITAHKIQGQTVSKPNELVADLNSVFSAGQAYVIFSRVQSLSQLHLLSFSPGKIRIDSKAIEETTDMRIRALNACIHPWMESTSDMFKILCLNIRSLQKHFPDILNHSLLMESNIFCFTETHLKPNREYHLELENYRTFLACAGPGKGVGIYVHNTIHVTSQHSHISPVFQLVSLDLGSIILTCVYRSTSSNQNLTEIFNIIQNFADLERPNVICGNFNISPNNSLFSSLKPLGYDQFVKFPTHDKGNVLDHLYTNVKNVEYFIHSLNFTDHDAILSIIRTD